MDVEKRWNISMHIFNFIYFFFFVCADIKDVTCVENMASGAVKTLLKCSFFSLSLKYEHLEE